MSEIKQKQSLAYSIRKNIYRKLENVAEFNGLNVCDLIKNIINEFLAKDKQEQNKILFNDTPKNVYCSCGMNRVFKFYFFY